MDLFPQQVTGVVVDAQGEPVFSAAVILQKPDSSFISATTTDLQGGFRLPCDAEEYLLCIQHLAYKTKFLKGRERMLGKIALEEKENRLSEVTVSASSPQVKVEENGALRYNMQLLTRNRPVRNALELLDEIPSVEKTGDDYHIIGAGGTSLLLNGRKTNMTMAQVKQLLSSLSTGQVEGVEVFYTTPPGYGVHGSSINVILKKEKSQELALNGDIFATLSQGHSFYVAGGANWSLSKGKWSWNVGYSPGNEKRYRTEDFVSYHTVDEVVHTVGIDNGNKTNRFAHQLVSDFNLDLGKKRSLNLFYSGNIASSESDQKSGLVKDGAAFRDGNRLEGDKNLHTVALDLTLKALKVGGDYLFYDEAGDQHLTSLSSDAEESALVSHSTQRAHKWNLYANHTSRVGSSNLSYGAEWGMSDTRNRYQVGENSIAPSDDSFSTDQREYRASLFASWSRKMGKKANLTLSLEAEYFKSTYRADGGSRQTLWEDLYLYPGMTFVYKMRPASVLQATVNSRKIYPSYWQTTPGSSYINSYWMTQGNTALKPYASYQMNLNYILKSRYVIGLGAILSPDYFTQQMYQDPQALRVVTRYVNFDYNRQYVLMGVVPFKWTGWFNSRLVATAFCVSQKGTLSDLDFQREKLTGRLTLTNNFTLDRAKCWAFQLTGFYQLPTIQGIYDIKSLYELSASLSWEQKNGPWKLTLKGTDPLDIYRQKTAVEYAAQCYGLDMHLDRQVFSLTVRYVFNGYKEKKQKQIDTSRFGL